MPAAHAAVALTGVQETVNLNQALRTRRQIGEAVGILMARCGLSEHEAFALLVKTSQNQNIKVRELAGTIIYTGDLPPRN